MIHLGTLLQLTVKVEFRPTNYRFSTISSSQSFYNPEIYQYIVCVLCSLNYSHLQSHQAIQLHCLYSLYQI